VHRRKRAAGADRGQPVGAAVPPADLGARIRALIAEAGVPPELIELEITESHLMHDPAQAIHAMRTLRDEGVRIAIDDFGTGYSSLAYLTRFPVAALKIDRSFVAGIGARRATPRSCAPSSRWRAASARR
jgi:EAL domain-containing protein (putative c-di-GMP-specific phosphodiesterase class I)